MTDTLKVQHLKHKIKLVIGEKEYLTFMNKLASSITPFTVLEQEYAISYGTLRVWAAGLGFRDATTRRCLTMHYKRLRRIKDRQERNDKLTKFLFGNRG